MPGSFVHLHVHSEYSLLDGANRVGKLVKHVSSLQQPAVALTDHGVMFGAMEFYTKAKEAGIKPILGCELYVCKDRLDRSSHGRQSPNRTFHLIALAKTHRGYQNLVKMVSIGQLEGFYYKPRIDYSTLERYSDDLILLSGCLGSEIPQHILQGNLEAAYDRARYFQEMRGDDFYLELQDHGLPEQAPVNDALMKMSKDLGLKLVASNDAHYTCAEDYKTHDALVCIQGGKLVSDPNKLYKTDQFYIKSDAEMRELFAHVPEALTNTLEIANKCNVVLELGRPQLPEYPLPEGETEGSYLEKLAREGAARRYKEITPEIEARLDYELKMMVKMGFPGYFLIVWDFIDWAKNQGIQVGPGRGSAAGSLVAYCLGITDIDPLPYNLLFERFLNPERVSMPDIDVDFCIERRGEVIKYVQDKYGADKVAQIVTFGTLGAKAAIKDTGRVLEYPFDATNNLTKFVADKPGTTLEQSLVDGSELDKARKGDPQVDNLISLAQKLEGYIRNTSIHAAGVVISRDPLDTMVPLQRASKNEDGFISTQYEQKWLEMMGLLKMDFLGLRNLTMIAKALQFIEQNHGKKIDWAEIPMDDPETYKFLQGGDAVGIFQLESEGMRNLVLRLKPSGFEDLAALIALYRPGPMESGMLDQFVNRKHGKEAIDYPHASLEPILKDTYGTCIYQEQVMQIAQVYAGYSLGQADLLRRAMGKKKPEEMAKQKEIFLSGAKEKGHPSDKAEALFDTLEKFAAYGFNKSHSAAYAVVTFRTAYLKAHYPTEYMCALLSSVIGTQDKVQLYIQNARDLGIQVLPPAINFSEMDFAVKEGHIRFGLSAIKNVGLPAVQAILAARAKVGKFTDLYQFCEEVDMKAVNKRVLEALIKCGVFDELGEHRGALLAGLEEAAERAAKLQKEQASGQISLFAALGAAAEQAVSIPKPKLPTVPPLDRDEELTMEKDLMGIYVSGHPLERYEDRLQLYSTHLLAEVEEANAVPAEDGTPVFTNLRDRMPAVVGGLLKDVRKVVSKKTGKPMVFGVLEDLTGEVEVAFFSEAYEKSFEYLANDAKVLVSGRFGLRDGRFQITADWAKPLSALPVLYAQLPADVDGGFLVGLRGVLEQHKGDVPVVFTFPDRPEQIVVGATLRVEPNDRLLSQLRQMLGFGSVKLEEPAGAPVAAQPAMAMLG